MGNAVFHITLKEEVLRVLGRAFTAEGGALCQDGPSESSSIEMREKNLFPCLLQKKGFNMECGFTPLFTRVKQ